jgi:hypothetical protein
LLNVLSYTKTVYRITLRGAVQVSIVHKTTVPESVENTQSTIKQPGIRTY